METTTAFVLVTIIICATVLVAMFMNYKHTEDVEKEKLNAEYWRGKYSGLSRSFDKGLNISVTDWLLEKISEIKEEAFK